MDTKGAAIMDRAGASMVRSAELGRRVIDGDGGGLRDTLTKSSSGFRHCLSDNPLFEIPRLQIMAERILKHGDPRNFVVFDGTGNSTETKFSAMPSDRKLVDVVSRLDQTASWAKLTRVQDVDPAYGALLDTLIDEIETISGTAFRKEISWSSLTIFLASPHVVTPYHIDHEQVFLFQIQGEKDYCVYDPNDRSLLSDDEIERFYAGDLEAADWRDELLGRGTIYPLAPGLAVQHPPLSPHWVRNGDNVSISFSVGLCLRPLDRRAKIYQINRCLREFGLSPRSPGKSAFADRMKIASLELLSKPNATDREDILFSGIKRLRAPARFAKRMIGRVAHTG